MKKILLPILVLVMITIATETAYSASSLEISTTDDFTSLSTNFSGGQTIFVRLEDDAPPAAASSLNLRDNRYNPINSFQFKKEGNYFSAVIPVPYGPGYYSLEGVIEYDGSSTKSVKTIKVGSPQNANVRVNVESNTRGSSSSVLGEREEETAGQNQSSPSPIEESSVETDEAGDQYNLDSREKNVLQNLTSFFKEVINFIWPFGDF